MKTMNEYKMEQRAFADAQRSIARRARVQRRNAQLFRKRLLFGVPFLLGAALLGWDLTRPDSWNHVWALVVGYLLVMPLIVTWRWKL